MQSRAHAAQEPQQQEEEEDGGVRDAVLVTDADSATGELVLLQLILSRCGGGGVGGVLPRLSLWRGHGGQPPWHASLQQQWPSHLTSHRPPPTAPPPGPTSRRS